MTHPSGQSKGYQEGAVLAEMGHRQFNKKRGLVTASFSVLQLSPETIWCVSIEIPGIGNEAAGTDVLCFFFLITCKMERKKRGLGAILINKIQKLIALFCCLYL